MSITFSAVVNKNRQKKDKTWNVKIRVTSHRKAGYISTDFHVMKHQLSRKGMEIVDVEILTACQKIIEKYTKYVMNNPVTSSMGVQELIVFLTKSYELDLVASKGISIAEIGKSYTDNLINQSREKYARSIMDTLNMLTNIYKVVPMSDITVSWLNALQSTLLSRGMKQSSVNVHLRNIRTLFNHAITLYNDDESGIIVIRHYPFRKFKFRQAETPAKRNVSPDVIKRVAELPDSGERRVDMARDVFILSFCLCGMNALDLYTCTEYDGERITYTRQKTKRKGDKARISVAVPGVCREIVDKFLDKEGKRVFDFSTRYSSPDFFRQNVNKGLAVVSERLGLDVKLTTYYARHSFATIARNDCGVSKDDIAVCLTHSSGHDITDRYIAEDWSIVDRTQAKVIDYVFNVKKQ